MIAALGLTFLLAFPLLEKGQETRAVRDSLGRTVAVPARVERVLSLQPEVTRIIVALGAGSRLVGRDDFVARFDHLFPLIYPSQSGLPVVSSADGFPKLETVMRLDPDLIFASPSEAGVPDILQKKTGKPVLAFSSMGRFEDLGREILWVGEALGRRERAEELAGFLKRRLEDIRRLTDGVSDKVKPAVYVSFWGSFTRSPVGYEPVAAAGGRNLADGLLPSRLGTIATEVNLEKILAWDPEIILLHGNYLPRERTVTVEGVLNDPRLRSVRAVRNRKVFYTFGFWYWWDPALALVETLMLAKLFHPETFREVDINREGNSIFKLFYGLEGGFDVLRRKLEIPDGPWR
ncbi:MAG: ABC transporter substrate-binding protein [Candidatus Aminicenantes bacterium]|nr:ABC transporter substrate-binding protein [Candidatus Aminicenantes bacterium]